QFHWEHDSALVSLAENNTSSVINVSLPVININFSSVCWFVFIQDEVLMVQEAKRECYGRWYLPAGRMEERESIVEALQREVKEEAGIDCQPITLLMVQEQGPKWVRFVFLAEEKG
uniref:Nudix hydrolase domain-containing protein n=1 Tax=Sinocyclocheilus grahami TaxID=75366 RepID=A0A672RFI1_SINGR